MIEKAPYSYKSDPVVPPFADDRPVIVIDGTCALCTRGIGWLLKFDKNLLFRVAPIQTRIGEALYRHYGFDPATYDTFMVISNGRAFVRTDGYIETCRLLGGPWTIFTLAKIIPKSWRDAVYYWLDRNRIKWFGRTEYCELIPKDKRHQVLD